MRFSVIVVIVISLFMPNLTFGAATIFFKDGTKEVGNSAWIEGNTIYLSKSKEIYEFSSDEVFLEDTLKFNKMGKYAEVSIAGTGEANAKGMGDNDLVEQLIAGSSLDRQLDQFVQQFSYGAMSSAGSNSELSAILAQALSGFDGQKAKKKIISYYRSHLSSETLKAVLSWTKSPLGLKIREVEAARAINSPEIAQQQLSRYDVEALPAQRRTLVRELDKSGQATEMTLQLVTDAITGAMGAIPAKTPEEKKARKEIEKQAALKKNEMVPELRKMVQASLAYTYQDLSDNELMEYIAFLHTEPARKFTRATMGAMSEMTKTMSATIIKNIIKASEQSFGAQGR